MTFKPYLDAINQQISKTSYGQHPVELYEPISYLMSLGGKRLRPVLTTLATHLFTDDWQKALKPAIAVEVFHNFTLMHDDIMDQAPLRRGKPTVHEKWNTNIAILSGDVMLVNAYELLIDVEPAKLPHILKRFNKTAAEVCEGQQLDMNFEVKPTVSQEEYLEMIRLKTSVLLGFALELGAIIGNADSQTTQALYDAGVNIGLGFQLKDDFLDVYGDPDKFGKQVGGDIIANKKTFMLIEALLLAEGSTKKELLHWLSLPFGTYDTQQKVSAITNIYNLLSIDKIAETKANQYFDAGYAILNQLSVNAERKQNLIEFVDFLVGREH